MYIVDFSVDNMDNFVDNSNFSSFLNPFKHKFFFINRTANAYFLRHNPVKNTKKCNFSKYNLQLTHEKFTLQILPYKKNVHLRTME